VALTDEPVGELNAHPCTRRHPATPVLAAKDVPDGPADTAACLATARMDALLAACESPG